jgi:hypothetical protein
MAPMPPRISIPMRMADIVAATILDPTEPAADPPSDFWPELHRHLSIPSGYGFRTWILAFMAGVAGTASS